MIKIGIVGYGNLGKGVESAIQYYPDLQLVAIFTRRDASSLKINSGAIADSYSNILNYKNKIDVLILCGGSATDLPLQTPELSQHFNVVDSYDTHALINQHINNIKKVITDKVAIVSIGWDPGLFSLNRLLGEAILPNSKNYTFWGDGVSQGHSDAIRRIEGVENAIQYTRPIESAIIKVKSNTWPDLSVKDKHLRDCYVVAKPGADLVKIENEIKNMPNYFSDYITNVTFISAQDLAQNHSKMNHGGKVFLSAKTGDNNHLIEYSLISDSNPQLTASILIAYARACHKLYLNKDYGVKTIFDIPLAHLSALDQESLIKKYL